MPASLLHAEDNPDAAFYKNAAEGGISEVELGELAQDKSQNASVKSFGGETFDKSYIKGMVDDHKTDIKMFEKEAKSGQDPEAKAFAVATLPTSKARKIQGIASAQGVT